MSLKEQRVDGLIFCSNALSDREILKWQESGPIIFVILLRMIHVHRYRLRMIRL